MNCFDAKRQSRFLLPNFPVGKEITGEASASDKAAEADQIAALRNGKVVMRLKNSRTRVILSLSKDEGNMINFSLRLRSD